MGVTFFWPLARPPPLLPLVQDPCPATPLMNFCLGKFKVQYRCWSFKFNGLEQIAAYDLKLEKDEPFQNSWHRHVYKRYDNFDTNLQLNLPPI